jgi:adenylosuccinate lyase
MVANGASRQEAHEEIRVLSHQASDVVKKEGGRNDLLDRIKKTKYFEPIWSEIDGMLDPKKFIGRSVLSTIIIYFNRIGPDPTSQISRAG